MARNEPAMKLKPVPVEGLSDASGGARKVVVVEASDLLRLRLYEPVLNAAQRQAMPQKSIPKECWYFALMMP